MAEWPWILVSAGGTGRRKVPYRIDGIDFCCRRLGGRRNNVDLSQPHDDPCSAKNLAVSARSTSSSTTGLLLIITTSSIAGRSVAIE
jgi:hypothetical protein